MFLFEVMESLYHLIKFQNIQKKRINHAEHFIMTEKNTHTKTFKDIKLFMKPALQGKYLYCRSML